MGRGREIGKQRLFWVRNSEEEWMVLDLFHYGGQELPVEMC